MRQVFYARTLAAIREAINTNFPNIGAKQSRAKKCLRDAGRCSKHPDTRPGEPLDFGLKKDMDDYLKEL